MLESPRQRDAEDSKIQNHLPSDMNTIPEQVLALGMGCLGSPEYFCQILSQAEAALSRDEENKNMLQLLRDCLSACFLCPGQSLPSFQAWQSLGCCLSAAVCSCRTPV